MSIEVQISGSIRYQDKQYGRQGFTGVEDYKYVRFATVELVDGLVVIDSTVSDELGRYSLAGKGVNLHLRVLAESYADVGMLLSVHNYNRSIYSVSRKIGIEGESEIDFDISHASPAVGAFNILDVYINSTQLISSLSTQHLPTLKTYWKPSSSAYGTYFCSRTTSRSACPNGKGIYLLGGTKDGGDTDEFDDDVLMHEYGHFIESFLGVQDSPGGSHYLTDNDSDLRLAWSEGWGGFFPSAVKSWLQQNAPDLLSTEKSLSSSYFIDTYGSFAGIAIDMGSPGSFFCYNGDACFTSSTSEVAVANVLNGMMTNFSMQELWDAYSLYAPSQTAHAASLEVFWDGWVAQHSPSESEYETLYTILNDRGIYYQLDDYEADGEMSTTNFLIPCSSNSCIGQDHYLYSSGSDIDNIKFEVQAGKTYQIETYNLSNAADTYLKILYDSGLPVYSLSGSVLQNNDRPGTVYCYPLESPCKVHNDDKMLSSFVQFTSTITGTYIAQVSTNSRRKSVAGRYGSYTIRIVEK